MVNKWDWNGKDEEYSYVKPSTQNNEELFLAPEALGRIIRRGVNATKNGTDRNCRLLTDEDGWWRWDEHESGIVYSDNESSNRNQESLI